ncbi:MAG: hypothetical protein MMC23_006821 [Stictis urceolatum]|nr:hypothetical protein [Stictis urceolata]
MQSLSNLPAELQWQILDNASASILVNLRNTSKYWRATIDERKGDVDRILKQDLAMWHDCFETWKEKFGSHVLRERAVAALLETRVYENSVLERGVFQKSFLPQETWDRVPWEYPFSKPGHMILPFETYYQHDHCKPGDLVKGFRS